MIFVFLADGFEEIEALTPVDLLRRTGLDVRTVGIGSCTPCGAHGIRVTADIGEDELSLDDMTAMILPGGMPGTKNLEQSDTVQRALTHAVRHSLPVGAICAAPSILGHAGLLDGRRAVCFPGFEPELTGASVGTDAVVTDGPFTTSRGAGTAMAFALELVRRLCSAEAAEQLRRSLQCP